jgi:hypothetical protein
MKRSRKVLQWIMCSMSFMECKWITMGLDEEYEECIFNREEEIDDQKMNGCQEKLEKDEVLSTDGRIYTSRHTSS